MCVCGFHVDIWRKRFPRKYTCKGPKANMSLVCLACRKKANVAVVTVKEQSGDRGYSGSTGHSKMFESYFKCGRTMLKYVKKEKIIA